jgi:hypothetical protein
MTLAPDSLVSVANTVALLGWALLVVAPRWRITQATVLSGALPLTLAVAYALLIGSHYLGPHASEGGFNSLTEVAALFQDPWGLLAGWVHYLCFDMGIGIWESLDACCLRSCLGRWGCCSIAWCGASMAAKLLPLFCLPRINLLPPCLLVCL